MDHRRKWDRDEYTRIALEKLDGSSDYFDEQEEEYTPLENLKPRDYKINFEAFKSRKAIIGGPSSKSYASGGFHCPTCDIIVKNDITFLDHINGRRHQKNLGMSMKVRRSTYQEIRRKLRSKKHDLEENKSISIKDSMLDIQEENQKLADLEHSKKKVKKVVQEETERELPSELEKVMGFSNFVWLKKK